MKVLDRRHGTDTVECLTSYGTFNGTVYGGSVVNGMDGMKSLFQDTSSVPFVYWWIGGEFRWGFHCQLCIAKESIDLNCV
jgi:hypothetical protein